MKIKTCRKESKETAYWLRLAITNGAKETEEERHWLRNEARELVLIFYEHSQETWPRIIEEDQKKEHQEFGARNLLS